MGNYNDHAQSSFNCRGGRYPPTLFGANASRHRVVEAVYGYRFRRLAVFAALNAVAWGCILALSFKYERPASLLAPCILGFGYLAWAYGTLDLSANPNAAIALVIIPFYALVPIAVGGILGYIVDRMLRRKNCQTSSCSSFRAWRPLPNALFSAL